MRVDSDIIGAQELVQKGGIVWQMARHLMKHTVGKHSNGSLNDF